MFKDSAAKGRGEIGHRGLLALNTYCSPCLSHLQVWSWGSCTGVPLGSGAPQARYGGGDSHMRALGQGTVAECSLLLTLPGCSTDGAPWNLSGKWVLRAAEATLWGKTCRSAQLLLCHHSATPGTEQELKASSLLSHSSHYLFKQAMRFKRDFVSKSTLRSQIHICFVLCNGSIRAAFNSGIGHVSGAGIFRGVSLLKLMSEVAHQHRGDVQLAEGLRVASLLQEAPHRQPGLRHQGFGMSCIRRGGKTKPSLQSFRTHNPAPLQVVCCQQREH